MAAPFISEQQPSNKKSSSSSSIPNFATNHQHLYFPKSVPSSSTKIENILLITNNSSAKALWKMRRSTNTPFLVHPTSGVLHPHEERRISITCTGEQLLPMVESAEQGNFSEKLQLNARFFHETDNEENVAACWNNKKAEDMKKLKIDLPIVLAENKNASGQQLQQQQQQQQQAAAAKPAPAVEKQQQQQVPSRSTSIEQQQQPSQPRATIVTPPPQQQQQAVKEAPPAPAVQQQQQKPAEAAPPAPTSNSNNNNIASPGPTTTTNNNKQLYTPSASLANSPSASVSAFSNNSKVSSPLGNAGMMNVSSSGGGGSSSAPYTTATSNNTSNNNATTTKKEPSSSAIDKIMNVTIPIYVFIPLLLITFSLGARLGGSNSNDDTNSRSSDKNEKKN